MISVIIPVKNGTNYLAEAVAGIEKQEIECEIVVVDDGSTDGTAELAHSLGCRVVPNEGTGQYAGVNTGIFATNGEFVLIHDHDDVIIEGVLGKMLAAMDGATEVVEAMAQDFVSPDAKQSAKPRPDPYYGFLSGAILFRRGVFDKTGVFDKKLHAANLKLLSAVKDLGIKTKRLDIVAVRRRIHDTNFGRLNKGAEYSDYARIMRERLRTKIGKKGS
jgi:glycosyltransferase involved in cell wall biosynthesis